MSTFVIGVVLGELILRVVSLDVCDDAVVRRTLVLIAFTVALFYIVAILRRILLYCWLLPVLMQQVNSENHTSKKYPNHLFNRFP